MGGTYRVREFAGLAGVTVRALHHYDRLGLLKPGRTAAGYRVYRDSDLERLEQIVALKYLGMPLRQIRTVLERSAIEWPEALRRQRRVLEEKRRLLDGVIGAVREAERALEGGRPPGSTVLKRIIEVIEMQSDKDWMLKYYEKEWLDLFRDIEAALGEDPASARARELADRWKRLVEAFTGGDPAVEAQVRALNADSPNWPSEFKKKVAAFAKPAVWEFVRRVNAAR